MNKTIIAMFTLFVSFQISTSKEIENVSFTDLNGKKYDLYSILNQKKYVFINTALNT
jgi:hypothetical protein